MSDRNRGGRQPPDNRPVQAKGVGKNSKRHDMERRDVPPLHGSDLQKGDVQALRQGQRIAPKQTQQPAGAAPTGAGGGGATTPASGGATVPDPIEFLGSRQGGGDLVPERSGGRAYSSKGENWLPILQMLASKPGTSGQLAQALIHQGRRLRQLEHLDAKVVDMQDAEDALEAMLDEGV